jgi:alpha-beta hydrolase superfamily lysophospholipase
MNHTTGLFRSKGLVELFYQLWQPVGEAKAVVIICHGVGEHSGRYMNLVKPLNKHSYIVCGYDHLGCGKSTGKRGHIESWDDYHSGLRSCLQFVQTSLPQIPVFLYGHSMGALIALDFIQRSPQGLQGVILSGSPIEPAGVGTPAKELIAKLLSRVWPTYSIDLGLNPASLSRDSQVVKAYREDPLVQRNVTVRWGAEAMSIQSHTAQRPDLIQLPVLFIHGSDDPLNLLSGVRKFFKDISYPDKQLQVYQGSLHEPHNDLEHDQVAQDLINWLDGHLFKRSDPQTVEDVSPHQP